jgi:hypothetical protein
LGTEERFETFVEKARMIQRHAYMPEFDGVLEEWEQECEEFLIGEFGKGPAHVCTYADSALFGVKFWQYQDTAPDTYAFCAWRQKDEFKTTPEVVMDFDQIATLPAESLVLNFFLAMLEEKLHIRFPEKDEAQIGELTNALTEKFLGVKLPEPFEKESYERRRALVKQ